MNGSKCQLCDAPPHLHNTQIPDTHTPGCERAPKPLDGRIRAWVGKRCLIASPVADDDGEWNGYEIGDDAEDCVFCDDPECRATVIDWQRDGDKWAGRLAERCAVDLRRAQGGES